ncbi:hypothetical protein FH972_001940 [Carpinus fangiana]|uniref:Uncharacterized protein n=1 Tax=Carpinus fangiana TaxID=176857 RepID=A0A5N6QFZ0_9ROSI|nr:hypothetical protein FH972_001940 [Carpinus fangiana]
MEWPSFLKALLLGLLVFLQMHENTACFHEERIALLELKAVLKSNIDHRLLSSWIDDAKSTDCCAWERVTCNSTTAHIINLSLYDLNQDPHYYDDPAGEYYSKYEDKKHWLLNVSLLVPFKELRSLNLSGNLIGGCVPNQGFERLAVLPKLEILDLGYNSFGNSIIPSLSGLTSLNTLSLVGNNLGRFNTTTDFESLSRLENLETLDLSYNDLKRSIIESLPTIKSLKNLNLGWNYMGGSFPIKGLESLSRLENLEMLDLSYNNFDKSIIESLSAVKSLKNLYIGWNDIGGSFPGKSLSNFSRLEILDLTVNSFTGSISPYIKALPSLKAISLAYNQLNGTFPKVKDPCAVNCNLNKLTRGNILEFLLDERKLKIIDLSHNKLKGSFPIWLIENNTRL